MAKGGSKKSKKGSRKTAKRAAAKGQQTARAKRRQHGAAPASINAGALASVNRIELAELMGVHPDTVSDYVRQGMPVIDRGGHGKEGVYPPALAMKWVREKFPVNPKDLAVARNSEANAKLAELRLKERMLELVPRDQIEREGNALLAALAAEIRMLPSQLTQAGVIQRDQEGAATKICRNLLSKISTWKTLDDLQRAVGAA